MFISSSSVTIPTSPPQCFVKLSFLQVSLSSKFSISQSLSFQVSIFLPFRVVVLFYDLLLRFSIHRTSPPLQVSLYTFFLLHVCRISLSPFTDLVLSFQVTLILLWSFSFRVSHPLSLICFCSGSCFLSKFFSFFLFQVRSLHIFFLFRCSRPLFRFSFYFFLPRLSLFLFQILSKLLPPQVDVSFSCRFLPLQIACSLHLFLSCPRPRDLFLFSSFFFFGSPTFFGSLISCDLSLLSYLSCFRYLF